MQPAGLISERLEPLEVHIRVSGSDWVSHGTLDLRSQRLGDAANLIDFQQQTVAGLLLHGPGDASGVGDGEVVSNNLDVCASSEAGPGCPVILVKGILDWDHWKLSMK